MNKIGWCDMTWNPVWGCLNHCEYCYARGIAKRFAGVKAEQEYYSHYWGNKRNAKGINKAEVKQISENLREFKPTFLYGQYFKKFPKKLQRIFVGSMSEIYYWNEEWVKKVLEKVKQYPQHTFQFLTKFPEVYFRYDFPKNCWLGMTIADSKYFNFNDYQKFKISNPNNLKFVSYEPLLDEIFVNLQGINWVSLGTETGNRKGKVIPKLEWITDIVEYCRNNKIPVYLKDSIIKLYPDLAFEYPNYHKFPGFYDKKEKR